jgi:hypothetical protein
MAAILISDLEDRLEYQLKDTSDVPAATFLYWIQNMSDTIYRSLVKEDPERFITDYTVTVTAGTNSYALPSDFMHVQSLGCGLYEPDSDGNATDRRFTLTGYGSSTTGYYINNTNLILTPPDYPNSDSLTLRYIPNPPTYTATTEYLTLDKLATGKQIIPDQYMNFAEKALEVLYFQWDEDPNNESLADLRYTNVWNDLLANIRKEPSAFAMPDISLSY